MVRSIPACTGEPQQAQIGSRVGRVYPRVYGGTEDIRPLEISDEGLSPRVRGNLLNKLLISNVVGSIPACTGEPLSGVWWSVLPRVYPRVYGGTSSEFIRLFAAMSLFTGV